MDEFLRGEEIRLILDDADINSFRSNLKLPALQPSTSSQPSTSTSDSDVTAGGCSDDPDVSRLEKSEIDSLLMPPPPGARREGLLPRPSLASLGMRGSIEECMSEGKPKESTSKQEEEGNGELDLTGIDDDEIDSVSCHMASNATDVFVLHQSFICALHFVVHPVG